MADAGVLKTPPSNGLRVRVPSPAVCFEGGSIFRGDQPVGSSPCSSHHRIVSPLQSRPLRATRAARWSARPGGLRPLDPGQRGIPLHTPGVGRVAPACIFLRILSSVDAPLWGGERKHLPDRFHCARYGGQHRCLVSASGSFRIRRGTARREIAPTTEPAEEADTAPAS